MLAASQTKSQTSISTFGSSAQTSMTPSLSDLPKPPHSCRSRRNCRITNASASCSATLKMATNKNLGRLGRAAEPAGWIPTLVCRGSSLLHQHARRGANCNQILLWTSADARDACPIPIACATSGAPPTTRKSVERRDPSHAVPARNSNRCLFASHNANLPRSKVLPFASTTAKNPAPLRKGITANVGLAAVPTSRWYQAEKRTSNASRILAAKFSGNPRVERAPDPMSPYACLATW
mmetsp:Transcript_12918/g.28285  ORF Transcript_12918/g.28285 Transcript_12918/m.28285 type:complete len:237 (-) Transcript_12918:2698-3408(-)